MENPTKSWWANASRENLQIHQDALLKRFLQTRAVPFTKFYGNMFSENDIDPRDIRTTDDLTKLPFTSKADFTNPRDFVIIPDEAVVKKQWRTVFRALTTGTS